MARIIDIVKAHLEANGFDGLVAVDADCGCLCADLQPCGEDFGQCRPGYRGLNTDQSSAPEDWMIYSTKEAAHESMALRVVLETTYNDANIRR